MRFLRSKKNKKKKPEDPTIEDNGKSIRKYKLLHTTLLTASALAAVYLGNNLWNIHKFDKYVNKYIEIAANVPSAGDSPNLKKTIIHKVLLSSERMYTF